MGEFKSQCNACGTCHGVIAWGCNDS